MRSSSSTAKTFCVSLVLFLGSTLWLGLSGCCTKSYLMEVRDSQTKLPLANANVEAVGRYKMFSYIDPRHAFLCGKTKTVKGKTNSEGKMKFALPDICSLLYISVNETWIGGTSCWEPMLTREECESDPRPCPQAMSGRPEIKVTQR